MSITIITHTSTKEQKAIQQNMSGIISKTKTQIEDIVYNKGNLRRNMNIALSIANRRGIHIPAALVQTEILKEDTSDMGSGENFLAPYMVPNRNESFVDIGANVGGWTFIVARKGFEVFAFEPSPKAFHILSTRAKKYPTVHTFSYAIGDQNTTGRLGTSAVNISGTMDEENSLPGGGTIDVAVRTLDSLNLTKVGVIKIDTECYEVPILKGAAKTITKFRPRLVIEVHRESGKAASTFEEELKRIETILDNMGYNWHIRYRAINLRGKMQPFVIATYQK